MTPEQIKKFLESHFPKRARSVVVVDFANVNKWNEGKDALGWDVGIPHLGKFVKHLSFGSQELRRFYYGSDYGPYEKNNELTPWSSQMLQHAQFQKFEVQTKRVKYIIDGTKEDGFDKKCDMDVEMAIDLVKLQDKYDVVFVFSGDGDLVYALDYLASAFQKKELYVFGARGHIGREVVDAEKSGLITKLFYANDFEYRLSRNYQDYSNRPPRSSKFRRFWR